MQQGTLQSYTTEAGRDETEETNGPRDSSPTAVPKPKFLHALMILEGEKPVYHDNLKYKLGTTTET